LYRHITNSDCSRRTYREAVIVESIAKKKVLPGTKSSEVVETLLEIIKITFESEEDVLISGFGKFCVKKKKGTKREKPICN